MEEVKSGTQYLDITPIRKGKRILTFLADLFLNFILGFLIFNLIVSPTAKKICDFETLNNNHEVYTNKMYSLFYKNNLVYKSADLPEYDLTDNIDYTYDYFLSYYACDSDTSVKEDSGLGNDIKNEVLYHYFNDILGNKEVYLEHIKIYNTSGYFLIDNESIPTGIKLQSDVAIKIEAYFDTRNEMSKIGKEYYSKLKEEVYLPIFAEVMDSIKTNNLTHPEIDISYIECKNEISKLEKFHKNLLAICAVISYIFSCLLYYFLIPVLTENRKTLAMLFLRNQRMEYETIGKIRNIHFIGSAFYSIITNASLIMFLPMILVPFNYLFSINILLYTSVISLIFGIIGLVFILVSKFNRSWGDILTSMVYISNDSLDAIYRSKGYKI